jgi:carbon monoxide dehydrogenase subunit G
MDLKGTYTFNAPRERVWALLMDTEAIAGCIPGCDALEPLGDDRYRATLTVALAAVTGTYQGTVAIVEKQEPESYKLLVEGQGRPGFVKGESSVTLVDQGATTAVQVAGNVQVGGAIARVGQRLVSSVGQMMMDRFFACLQAKVQV